jgi:hypothetical protein
MSDEDLISVDRESTGAYIELFTRNDKPVARMNFFDDKALDLEQLSKYRDALTLACYRLQQAQRG